MYSKVQHKVEFYNENNFSVFVDMHFSRSGECSIECIPKSFNLGVETTETVLIEFKSNSVGNYQTIINSMINNMHTIPIIFRANVMLPTLTPHTLHTVINLTNPFPSTPLILSNNLNVPVQYAWNISAASCFYVRPKSGVIASQRSIVSEIYYQLDYSARFSSKLKLECLHGIRQTITSTIFVDKLDVRMRDPDIEAPHVPLNIPYCTEAIILNRSYQPIYYSLKNPKPLNGISITPAEGIIPRRSYQILTVTILLKNIISFRCCCGIDIDNSKILYFNINGRVDFPELVYKPDKICLKRIVAGSYNMQAFSMHNVGKSVINIEYRQEYASEFYIADKYETEKRHCLTEFTLNPGEKRHLRLLYFPVDVTMGTTHLPFVINGILGPPLTEEKSLLTETYIHQV